LRFLSLMQKRWGDGVMRDLEVSLRAKVRLTTAAALVHVRRGRRTAVGGGFPDLGAMLLSTDGLTLQGPVHPADDTMLERCRKFAYFSRLLGCTFSGLSLGFLATSFLVARHPPPRLVSPSISNGEIMRFH
jgi:hypothetical protein